MKDVHHAEFNDGPSEGGQSQRHQDIWGSPKAAFRKKLVGEIPGAFVKAFDFMDLMDDDVESNDEVMDLQEGLAAVKLSRETKLQIQGPWAQMLISSCTKDWLGLTFSKASFNFFGNQLEGWTVSI